MIHDERNPAHATGPHDQAPYPLERRQRGMRTPGDPRRSDASYGAPRPVQPLGDGAAGCARQDASADGSGAVDAGGGVIEPDVPTPEERFAANRALWMHLEPGVPATEC